MRESCGTAQFVVVGAFFPLLTIYQGQWKKKNLQQHEEARAVFRLDCDRRV